jgi:hypothetical protein
MHTWSGLSGTGPWVSRSVIVSSSCAGSRNTIEVTALVKTRDIASWRRSLGNPNAEFVVSDFGRPLSADIGQVRGRTFWVQYRTLPIENRNTSW